MKPNAGPLRPGEQWHGFSDADANHMFLDPVKVTILTPGMDEQGNMSEEGIPAALVAKFLDERGIVVEKTGPYNLLFLFSIGIDKTKAMGLLRGLTEFKRSYDLNLRIKNMLPDLYAEDPDFYRNMRIQDLAQGIHKLIRKHDLPGLMLRAFDTLPEMIMTPHQAWQRQIKGEVETIALEQLVGRVSANMIPALSTRRTAADAGRNAYRREPHGTRFSTDALFRRATLPPVLKRIFTARNRTKTVFTAYES